MYADLVLENANTISMDPSLPGPGLVAVKDGRFVFTGPAYEAGRLKGPGTRVINCEGKTLVPGFIDAHCHIFSFMRNQLTIDLSPPAVRSIEDIKARILKRVRETPPGTWINGSDYNEFYLVEKRHPIRRDLDEVAPDHPVVLSHRSLHACVLNSRALALAGIGMETPEPPGGRIERDPQTGEPNGVLFEMLGHIRYHVMPSLSHDEVKKGLTLAGSKFLSLGITSLQDATVTNDVKRWGIYRDACRNGVFKGRIYLMTGTDRVQEFQDAGITFRSGDDRLRMGGLKIVLGEATGQLHPSQDELERNILGANRAGYQVAIHAVQARTVEAAVTALESAQRQMPRHDLRHRLEHCAECPPALFERILTLRPVISTQPPFLHYSGERYLARISPGEIPWLYRIKSFLDAGMVVAAGSDSPVVPNDPLVGMYGAVTRRAATGEVLSPEERISARQALALYTVNAAYASFDEGIKGTISDGKMADLVLLSDDPTKAEPEQIKDIKVLKTIVGGEVVWEG